MSQLATFNTDLAKGLYNLAFHAYSDGKYLKATHIFRYLSFNAPTQGKHWLGLGASLQMCQKFEEAAEAYAMAALLDPMNPLPHLHAAESLFMVGNRLSGKKALQSALTLLENGVHSQEIVDHCKLLKQIWCHDGCAPTKESINE